MNRFFEKLHHRYDSEDHTSKLKARFILYVCIVSLVVIPITILYSAFLQLNDPLYHYSIDWTMLLPIFGALIMVMVYTLLLVKGQFRFAAHGILIMLMVFVWTIMFLDKSDPVTRLDTIVLVIAILSATSLAVIRYPVAILIYAAVNAIVLIIFVEFQNSRLNLLYVTYYDYLFDNIIAIIFISIFSYNIFMISRRALDLSEEQKRTLADSNEDLNVMNEMLKVAHERSMAEIELAGRMQGSIFPKEPPLTVGWNIAFLFKPVRSVSGDFYDFYYNDRGLQGISLFDVSGHGVAAGLITMIAKPILHGMFSGSEEMSLSRMMDRVSKIIFNEIKNIDSFITGIAIRFKKDYAEYVNVGHHDLLMKKAGTCRVKPVAPEGRDYRSSPIGRTFGRPEFKTVRFRIDFGDVLCLMTDGILEGHNVKREKFGKERMIESFQDAPRGSAQEILDHIVMRFEEFMGGNLPHDDYVIIIAKKNY